MANEGMAGRMDGEHRSGDKAGERDEKRRPCDATHRAVEDAEGNRNIEGPFETVAALIANLEKD